MIQTHQHATAITKIQLLVYLNQINNGKVYLDAENYYYQLFIGGVEDENVEIISCDAAEAIKKFKSGELESSSDLKGEQITEAVEDGITKKS